MNKCKVLSKIHEFVLVTVSIFSYYDIVIYSNILLPQIIAIAENVWVVKYQFADYIDT
jgi:hypothetical protein